MEQRCKNVVQIPRAVNDRIYSPRRCVREGEAVHGRRKEEGGGKRRRRQHSQQTQGEEKRGKGNGQRKEANGERDRMGMIDQAVASVTTMRTQIMRQAVNTHQRRQAAAGVMRWTAGATGTWEEAMDTNQTRGEIPTGEEVTDRSDQCLLEREKRSRHIVASAPFCIKTHNAYEKEFAEVVVEHEMKMTRECLVSQNRVGPFTLSRSNAVDRVFCAGSTRTDFISLPPHVVSRKGESLHLSSGRYSMQPPCSSRSSGISDTGLDSNSDVVLPESQERQNDDFELCAVPKRRVSPKTVLLWTKEMKRKDRTHILLGYVLC